MVDAQRSRNGVVETSGREAPAELHTRLVQSGLALIEQSGAAKLSLREVAKHAGVSHMAPYSHFRNKSELLCAVAAVGFGLLRKHLGRAAASKAGHPAEQFLDTGLAYVDFARRHPQLVGLMFGGIIQPADQTAELAGARGLAFSDLCSIAEEAMRRGQFRQGDPVAVAFAGWSIAHGFSQLALGGEVQDKLGQRNKAALSYARTVLSKLIDGLRAS
jgi:AcrR family transcriptional regulator